MKKRIFSVLSVGLLAVALTACQKTQSTSEALVTGGWALSDQKAVALSDDLHAAFDKIAEGENKGLVPVAHVAQQAVAGTNEMLLCRKGDEYRMIVVYRDLEDGVELTSNVPFKLADFTQDGGEAPSEQLSGGWHVPDETNALPLPKDAQTAFETALSQFEGSSIEPVALLGTQVVAGTNYAILCRVTPVAPDAISSMQVVTVYADLEGKAEFTSFCVVDPTVFAQ